MKYLFNNVKGEHLYIEENGGIFSLVSHLNRSDKDGISIRQIIVTFENPDLLKNLALSPVWSEINITSHGSVKFNQEINQVGSVWDADETVVGIHDDWTIDGLFSVNIQIDSQNRLGVFTFEGEPFACPFRPRGWGFMDERSHLEPSELNVTHKINPWGYMIYNPGDVSVRYSDHTAHIIATSSEEPMFFTPEKDVPGYLTVCGVHTGNSDWNGAVSEEMTMADFERKSKDYIKCPTCFPESAK